MLFCNLISLVVKYFLVSPGKQAFRHRVIINLMCILQIYYHVLALPSLDLKESFFVYASVLF